MKCRYNNDPSSWIIKSFVNHGYHNLNTDGPIALLPKYSPTGEMSVGTAWAQDLGNGNSSDIYFNAEWLSCYYEPEIRVDTTECTNRRINVLRMSTKLLFIIMETVH